MQDELKKNIEEEFFSKARTIREKKSFFEQASAIPGTNKVVEFDEVKELEAEEAELWRKLRAIRTQSEFKKAMDKQLKCDVCSEETVGSEGYILATRQLVCVPGYWHRVFSLLQRRGGFDERKLDEEKVMQMVKQVVTSRSNWWICDECMSYLEIDYKVARKRALDYLATGISPAISDAGPIENQDELQHVVFIAIQEYRTHYAHGKERTSW